MLIFLITSVVDKIKEKMEGINTFTAKIIQTTYLQGQKTVYMGNVYIKRPFFFRWELYEPEKYVVVSNGDSTWIFYRGEIVSQPMPYNLSDFLRGNYEGFKVKETKVRNGWKLKLTSEEPVGFDSIVVFITKDYLLKRVKIYNFSDWIDIHFKSIKLNVDISDSLFLKPQP